MDRYRRDAFFLLLAPFIIGPGGCESAMLSSRDESAAHSTDDSGSDSNGIDYDADTSSPWDSADGGDGSCGDGFLDSNEICELGDSASCTDIAPSFAAGLAYCEAGCTAWSTFQCACAAGYYKVDGICEDIDECAEAPCPCDENAECTNTTGGFECSCLPGYNGDGVSCAPIGDISADAWTQGSLSPEAVVSEPDLHPLPGKAAGPPIFVSNNPEAFFSSGWLMQSSGTDSSRGGAPLALEGVFPLYLFHINASGGTKYLHVLVTNAGPTDLSIYANGSIFTSTQYPCAPDDGQPGQSYEVAKDWLSESFDLAEYISALSAQDVAEIARVRVNDADMVDGRIEIDTHGPVYVHVVVTSTGDFSDAVATSSGAPAKGEIVPPGPKSRGRQAGIYLHSEWEGEFDVALPKLPSHIAFPITSATQVEVDELGAQDQSAAALVHLDDSAERSYGNNGWKYGLDMSLTNGTDTPKTVSMWFAHHLQHSFGQQGYTWNGPIEVGDRIRSVLTTPTRPKTRLETWVVEPGKTVRIPIKFYVPGLVTGGAQLILESE